MTGGGQCGGSGLETGGAFGGSRGGHAGGIDVHDRGGGNCA